MNINTTIGLTTTVPIGICGLLYIFITFAPVIYPQSPYQTSFSSLIWYIIQKSSGRRFKDRDGESKFIHTNMAQGQMQLSMEETKERKGRDKRAILWLLDNLTEDAEIESFALSIPGSFNGEWSFQVWRELSKFKEDDMPVVAQRSSCLRTIPNVLGLTSADIHCPTPTPSIHERNTIHETCARIGHLFDTCKNRAVFASDELWRRRARACVEATASMVNHSDAEFSWFGNILQMLGDIGRFEGMRNLSATEKDQTFVVRWTCLSIMAIEPILSSNVLKEHAGLAVESFGRLGHSDQDRDSDRNDEAAEEIAREIDKTLEDQWDPEPEWHFYGKIFSVEGAMQNIDGMEAFLESVDSTTINLNEMIDKVSQQIIHQIPGVHFDFPNSEPFLQQTLELFRDPPRIRFTSCRRSLKKFLDYLSRICFYQVVDSLSLRKQKKEIVDEKLFWPKNLLQRTLWSLQDFRDGGGLAFAVELFLLAVEQQLSTSSLQESSYSTLYTTTSKTITSDWRRYRHSLGTQKILLDAVASDQGILRTFNYPDYVTDNLWELLGDMLDGQTGPHIDSAVQQLTDLHREDGDEYGAKALGVIARLRASCSQESTIPAA
jgi:hypothetical protein